MKHTTPIIADLHNDLPYHVLRHRQAGRTRVIETTYLEDMRAGGANLIFCAIFLGNESAHDWKGCAMAQAEALLADIEESHEHLQLCTTLGEIEAATAASKVALVLAMEGCEPLESTEDLREFHRLGLRMIGPTWARKNRLGDFCSYGYISTQEEAKGGLTPYGFEIAHEARKLGMMIDTSHVSEKTFWDILQVEGAHVLATHTNAQAIHGTRRNFSDAQIRALVSCGGMIGLNGVASIIQPAPYGKLLEGFMAHLNHIGALAGTQNIALGIDLYKFFDEGTTEMPDAFDGYRELPLLREAMGTAGYCAAEIDGVLGGNVMAYLERIGF